MQQRGRLRRAYYNSTGGSDAIRRQLERISGVRWYKVLREQNSWGKGKLHSDPLTVPAVDIAR